MLGFKDRYQLNKWKLMGTGHAAEMKEGDRKVGRSPASLRSGSVCYPRWL